MSVPIPVITQSMMSLIQVGAEMALLLQRAQSGEPVSEAEWQRLRSRMADAERSWEEA